MVWESVAKSKVMILKMTEKERVKSLLNSICELVDGGGYEDTMTRLLGNSKNGFLNWYYTLSKSRLDVVVESDCFSHCGNTLNTESIKIFETVNNERSRYYLHFELRQMNDLEIFVKLILDLFECSDDCSSGAKGLSLIIDEFLMWKSMLKHRGEAKEIARGVIGELWTILKLLEVGRNPNSVINAWTGPDYAKQDFMFEDLWIESKMIGSNAAVVRISSLGQLDNPDRPGYLCVITADECDENAAEAVSVRILKDMICEKLKDAPSAELAFKTKLNEFEYNRFLLSGSYTCAIAGEKVYLVEGQFPRLFNSAQMPGLKNVHYQIELAVIEHWQEEEGAEVWQQKQYMNRN